MDNRLFLRVLGVASVSLIGSFQVLSAPTVLNGIKAVVNGEAITKVELDEAVRTQVQMLFMNQGGRITNAAQAEREIRKIEETALNDLIDRKLILSEFKSSNNRIPDKFVDEAVNNFVQSRFKGDRDKFLGELAKQGITLNQFRDIQRDQIAIQALQAKHAQRGNIFILPEERKAVYEEIKGQYSSSGQPVVRMLSVPKISQSKGISEQKGHIESIRSKIQRGSSFSSMAKKYSQDSFAGKGGYVGVIGRGTLNQNLTNIAYGLSPGRVSSVIDDGPTWRLLIVDKRVGQKVPSQKDLEKEIEKVITTRKRKASMEGWLKKLRRDANVRIFQ